MDSSELLRLQLAKKLECSRIGYASGPTGPTGPAGDTGPTGADGNTKIFTFFLDFSSQTTISRIFIPPGFSTDPLLAAGGIFTGSIGSNLIINGTSVIINLTRYIFPVGLTATGYYNGGFWAPSPYATIGTATGIRWRNVASISNLNTINLLGLSPLNLNGGSVTPRYPYIPGTNTPNTPGWLATFTIYYL